MKYFLTFIAGSLIGYILASFLLNTESRPTIGTLVTGTPDSTLVQGVIKEQVKQQVYEGHATLQRSEVRSQKSEKSPLGRGQGVGSSSFEKTILLDSLGSIDLGITTFPPADSIHLSYFANIKERTFERTDTLFITRIDTLTLKEVIEQPRAFYDNFWAGAAVVALLLALISGLL